MPLKYHMKSIMSRPIQEKCERVKKPNTCKKPVKHFLNILINIFFEFATFTSLHGLNNIFGDYEYLNKALNRAKLSKRFPL